MSGTDAMTKAAELRARLEAGKRNAGTGGASSAGASSEGSERENTKGSYATQGSENEEIESISIDPSEVQTPWTPVRSPVEVVGIVDYVKDDKKSYKVTFLCFDGPNKGLYRNDWMPKQGGGLVKLYCFAEAIDCRDKDTGKVSIGSKSDVLGKKLWVNVIEKPEKRELADGSFEVSMRDELEFPRGFSHISKYELPSPLDPFAEGDHPVRTDL